jgi:hypothetical protein
MKKTRSNIPAWKPILTISAIVIAVAALFFGWQYAINRPNYHDLQKEFSKLSIPANWKLVSESNNRGVLGLFCWQIEGSECPYVGAKYSKTSDPDPVLDKKALTTIVESAGFQLIETDDTNCILGINNYYCSADARKNKLSLEVSIGVEDSMKILRLHLGQYAKP